MRTVYAASFNKGLNCSIVPAILACGVYVVFEGGYMSIEYIIVFAFFLFGLSQISSARSSDFLDRRNTLSDDFSGSSLLRSIGVARMFDDDTSDFAWSGSSHGSDLFDSVSSSSSGFSSSTRSSLFDDDSGGFSSVNDLWMNDGPAFNIDGSPMIGSFDVHGNVYGVTSNNDMFSSSSDMFSSSGCGMFD